MRQGTLRGEEALDGQEQAALSKPIRCLFRGLQESMTGAGESGCGRLIPDINPIRTKKRAAEGAVGLTRSGHERAVYRRGPMMGTKWGTSLLL